MGEGESDSSVGIIWVLIYVVESKQLEVSFTDPGLCKDLDIQTEFSWCFVTDE